MTIVLLQMEIMGKGFKLRTWHADDVVSLQKHANNPKICAFLLDRFPQPYTMEEAKHWVAAMMVLTPWLIL